MHEMPPKKGEVEDAPVPGTFVYFHGKPKRRSSARVGWVVAENGCHIWQGAGSTSGYGRVVVGNRLLMVHRVRYEREVGPIPEGMHLDHFVCDNGPGGCCNPAHVRPVSPRSAFSRGETITSSHAARTHCVNGHPFSGNNLYTRPRGDRECRTCMRRRAAAYSRRVRSRAE